MESQPVKEARPEVEILLGVSTATIATQLHRRGIRSVFLVGVKPLDPENAKFAGPAHTLRYIPAREDIDTPDVYSDPVYPQRAAIERTELGQVLVIDARGHQGAGVLGSILTRRLQVRGAAAVVSDGAVRDAAAIRETGLPVHAAGTAAPLSVHAHHAADFDVPIACGGVAVYPGDMIVGDEDGVICIPADLVSEVASGAVEQQAMETYLFDRISRGDPLVGTYPPSAGTRAAYEEHVKAET